MSDSRRIFFASFSIHPHPLSRQFTVNQIFDFIFIVRLKRTKRNFPVVEDAIEALTIVVAENWNAHPTVLNRLNVLQTLHHEGLWLNLVEELLVLRERCEQLAIPPLASVSGELRAMRHVNSRKVGGCHQPPRPAQSCLLCRTQYPCVNYTFV